MVQIKPRPSDAPGKLASQTRGQGVSIYIIADVANIRILALRTPGSYASESCGVRPSPVRPGVRSHRGGISWVHVRA